MQGIEGVPVPYSIATDNVLTLLLIVCFVATIVVVASIRRSSVNALTFPCQCFLFLEMCLMYATLYFAFLKDYVVIPQIDVPCLFVLTMFVLIAVFFFFKRVLTRVINWVFFTREACRTFSSATLLLMGMEGLCLIPAVYLYAYVNIPLKYALIYGGIVLVLFRILTIYRQKQIFFRQKGRFFGFFIYLCTLELTPFFILWSIMAIISGNLIKNVLV